MRTALVAFLLLFQAGADDPSAVSAKLDDAVRAIPGYKDKPEAKVIGDEAFLKRIFKDLVDGIPTADEIKAFVNDPDAAKRAKKVEQLLQDDRFADVWSMRFGRVFFGDITTARFTQLAELPVGGETSILGKFVEWFSFRIRKDTPWTEIVKQMLDARGTTEGDPALGYHLSFYRGQDRHLEFAEGLARHFMGTNLYCTRCHDHPFDRWSDKHIYSLAAFVSRQKVRAYKGGIELKYADQGEYRRPDDRQLGPGRVVAPAFLNGEKPGDHDDWMRQLGFYLTDRGNTLFVQAFCNRVWSWLLGSGIVEPVDDLGAVNRPISDTLLKGLTRDTVDHQYSLKRLVRVICGTQAYQMPLPEEAPDASSFRHSAEARATRGRYTPAVGKPALPIALEVSPGWMRMRAQSGAKAVFLARGKADRSLFAEMSLHVGKKDKVFLDTNITQFVKPKKETQVLQGKLKVVLGEVSGPNTCIRGAQGPVEYTVLTALIEAKDGPYTFRFEGPSAVVNEWREDFLAMLKSAGGP